MRIHFRNPGLALVCTCLALTSATRLSAQPQSTAFCSQIEQVEAAVTEGLTKWKGKPSVDDAGKPVGENTFISTFVLPNARRCEVLLSKPPDHSSYVCLWEPFAKTDFDSFANALKQCHPRAVAKAGDGPMTPRHDPKGKWAEVTLPAARGSVTFKLFLNYDQVFMFAEPGEN